MNTTTLHLLLSAASGVALVLTFPHAAIEALAPVALTPLLVVMAREKSMLKRAIYGELAGFLFWIGCCYWIRDVLAHYGGLNAPLAWLALVLFAIVKALHTAAFAALGGLVMDRWWAIPALAALWTGIESTHGTFGFAWLALGNAGQDMGVPMRLAPATGVYGLSFVFAMLACGLALLLLRRPRLHLAWLVAMPLLFLLPELPDAAPGTKTAVALQPNLAEGDPVDIVRMAARTLIAHRDSDLVIWPEVPAGLYWDRDEGLRDLMRRLTRDAKAPAVFGVVTFTPAGAPLNTAVVLGEDGTERGRYSKTNLVPFGEFIPPMFSWIEKISTEAGDFAKGGGPAAIDAGSMPLGVFICYESAFPEYVRRYAEKGATVLVNISNDGWFGDSAARAQHLQLARMRAAENLRWLLRVTNNGITASIDPAGRIAHRVRPFTPRAEPLPFDMSTQTTFYSRYGDWFAYTCLAASATLIAIRWRRLSRGG